MHKKINKCTGVEIVEAEVGEDPEALPSAQRPSATIPSCPAFNIAMKWAEENELLISKRLQDSLFKSI